jgi:hypothetical protein
MRFSHHATHLKNLDANKFTNHKTDPQNKKLIIQNDQLTKIQLDGKNRRSKMPQDAFKKPAAT